VERIGKFVIRKQGAVQIYRVIGYDFERQKCIIKRLSSGFTDVMDLMNVEDFATLKEDDVLYSAEDTVDFVNQHIEWLSNANDILVSIEKGVSRNWTVVQARPQFQTELSHLYNALDNTLTTLSCFEHQKDSQAYKEYLKSLHNLKKRFYFYYKEDGRRFIDYMVLANCGASKPIKERILSVQFLLRRHKNLLKILQEYIEKVPEIKYI
jgi:hypothetical protein